MKTIITAAQMRDADRYTIRQRPIASLDLMENASSAFVATFIRLYPEKNSRILVCSGTGNNGGDGLAIARLLQAKGYDAIVVWIARFTTRESEDFATNLSRLSRTPVPVAEFLPSDELPHIQQDVIIDALFGSGLNKPLEQEYLRLAQHINRAGCRTVAVDIPSGLRADGIIPEADYTIHANDVITFHRPKLSFFFPESASAMDRFHTVDIGLDDPFIERLPSVYRLVETADAQRIYRRRKPFSHKGKYGHALVVAGDTNTMGAALLVAGASVYAGAGLTSASVPDDGLTALNVRYPEVMYYARSMATAGSLEEFDAVAIGPGLGADHPNLPDLMANTLKPMVVDADAITFLSRNPRWIHTLPKQSILTPHMKEFDRLFGRHASWWERIQTARQQAIALQLVILLKNRYTFIAFPDGRVFISPTGNPAMATGGMGDVLTGVLVSFLAQGYRAEEAAVLGCFVHGLAGDRLHASGMSVVPATRVIGELPYAVASLHE